MRKAGTYYKLIRMHPDLQGITNGVGGGHQMRNLTIEKMFLKKRKNRLAKMREEYPIIRKFSLGLNQ